MEKAEISRLINSFNAIKGYFDTTKRYMPQIAKLVFFIEEIVPLLNLIHDSLHVSSSLIPTATEKLDKVTSATEMAATEVMDKVDNVINRLDNMTESLDKIEEGSENGINLDVYKEKSKIIRDEIDGSQDDLFSIMNALQFQDITTQQINSIASTIDSVHKKLTEMLRGFEDDSFDIKAAKEVAFDPNAEFDFERSAESQAMADEFLKLGKDNLDDIDLTENKADTKVSESKEISTGAGDPGTAVELETTQEAEEENDGIGEIVFGDDGQPDISSIMSQLNANKKTE